MFITKDIRVALPILTSITIILIKSENHPALTLTRNVVFIIDSLDCSWFYHRLARLFHLVLEHYWYEPFIDLLWRSITIQTLILLQLFEAIVQSKWNIQDNNAGINQNTNSKRLFRRHLRYLPMVTLCHQSSRQTYVALQQHRTIDKLDRT
jgi:hypothetical protein